MKKIKGLCSIVLVVVLCLSLSVTSFASVASITGDANSDRVVNLRDLVRMKKYIAHTVDDIDLGAVDFDNDGEINAYELVQLKNLLIKVTEPELIIDVEKLEDNY